MLSDALLATMLLAVLGVVGSLSISLLAERAEGVRTDSAAPSEECSAQAQLGPDHLIICRAQSRTELLITRGR